MLDHTVNTTAMRPGYSGPDTTFKPLSLVTSGRLKEGDQVSARLFEELGISLSESYEVRISWRHMGWLDKENRTTKECVRLAFALNDEAAFRVWLEKDVHEHYFEVFKLLNDPAHATQQELKDAFQKIGYKPVNMQSKMITLFKGFCRRVGLISDEGVTPVPIVNQSREPLSPTAQETPVHPTISDIVEGNALMAEPPSSRPPQMNGSVPKVEYTKLKELNEFLTRLIQMPNDPGWTEDDLDWWQQAVSGKAAKIVQASKDRGGRNQ